jgi:glycine cleavage system H protein
VAGIAGRRKKMAVILMIVTFAVFIVIDMVLNRKKAIPLAEAEHAPQHANDAIFSGFHVPQGLRYHPGHTWLARERKNVNRVGADEFAAIFAGPVDRIELPRAGTWVRQGQKAITLFRGNHKMELVSPVEGEVVDVNEEITKNPALLLEEPYGRGWFMTVFTPDEEGPARNLLPVNLLKGWMRDAADRLYAMQPQLAGATAADGGRPVKNATANFNSAEWERAARELFLD